MNRGYFQKKRIHPKDSDDDMPSSVPLPSKRKSNRLPPKPKEVI